MSKPRWTEDQKRFVRKNLYNMSVVDIAEAIGKTYDATYSWVRADCDGPLDKDDDFVIRDYGVVKPDFTIGGSQTSPVWMVITSPYFDTREVNFEGRGSRNKVLEDMVVDLHDQGFSFEEIGEFLGVDEKTARTYYKICS